MDVDSNGNVVLVGSYNWSLQYSAKDSIYVNESSYYYEPYYGYDYWSASPFVASYSTSGQLRYMKNLYEMVPCRYDDVYYENAGYMNGFELLEDGSWYIIGWINGLVTFDDAVSIGDKNNCYSSHKFIAHYKQNGNVDLLKERNGKLYVTNWSDYNNVVLLKIDLKGNVLSESKIGSNVTYYYEELLEFEIDYEENVYMVIPLHDWSEPTIKNIKYATVGGDDFWVVKYTPTLDVEWVRQVGGAFDDAIADLKIDAENNLYLAGSFQNKINIGRDKLVSDGEDAFVTKNDPSGDFLWVKQFGSIAGQRRLCAFCHSVQRMRKWPAIGTGSYCARSA